MSEWMQELLANKQAELEVWKKEAIGYREALAKAEKALVGLVGHEDGDCRLDHHGNCQAHSLGNPCDIKIGKESLAEIRRVLGGK